MPHGVAADSSGNLFIVDSFGPSIREVSVSGIISTIVRGSFNCCASGDRGPAFDAQLNDPAGIALDGVDNFYIADALNSRIRKVSSEGIITTVASGCGPPDDYDAPCGIAADARGNIYVSDEGGVHKISPDGAYTNVSATPAYGIAVDSAGNLYIADQFSFQIRHVSPAGEMTTVAGNGTRGYSGDGGPATAAQLSSRLPWRWTAPATSISLMRALPSEFGGFLPMESSPRSQAAVPGICSMAASRPAGN